MNSLRDLTVASQSSGRQRVTPLHLAETLPRDAGLARAATEPLVPGTRHVVPEATEAREIAGDAVIREVPPQLPRQGVPLLRDRSVSVLTAPLRHRRQRPAEPAPGRLALHRPVPLEGPAPVVGEPQEIERAGALVTGARWGSRWSPLERDQPGLFRMEGQAVLPKALGQDVQDPSRIAFPLEDQDRVIRVADQVGPPVQAGLDRLLEPRVEDLMEVGVGQEGADHPALGAAGFGMGYTPVLQHTRVEPLADQS